MENLATLHTLRDLAVIMVVAAGALLVFHALRLPVILGYIVAGLVVGPHTPPVSFVSDQEVVNELADLGIILLMFHIGLEFSFKRLRRVSKVAVIGGALQILIVLALGYQLGLAFGWNSTNALLLGAALSISSTALIVKVLEELRKTQTRAAEAVIGILIFEDFAAIALISIFAGLGKVNGVELSDAWAVLGRLTLFALAVIPIGIVLVPRLMNYTLSTGRQEVSVIVGLGLCFGLALFSEEFGLSVAAGAFLGGALIAEAKRGEAFHQLLLPVRDMFAAIFFVAIGMLLDPAYLREYWPHILAVTAFLLVAKTFAGTVSTFILGYERHTALQVGMSLAQIGEFSLIIVKVGLDNGTAEPFLYPIVVGVMAISALTTPIFIRSSERAGPAIDRAIPHIALRYIKSAEGALGRLQRLAGEPGKVGSQLRHDLIGIAINGVFLIAIMAGGRAVYENRESIPWIEGLSRSTVAGIVLGGAIALALAPLAASIAYIRSVSAHAARGLTNAPGGVSLLTRRVARVVLRNALLFIFLLALAAMVNIFLPPLESVPYLTWLILGAVLLFGSYLVLDSVQAMHKRVENILRRRLTANRDEALKE